ncbi:MAG: hypothetical protein HZC24_12425 [Rhodocyclales bacterium]|nr:hypothetical protein [Rhodocyclales bacterium]
MTLLHGFDFSSDQDWNWDTTNTTGSNVTIQNSFLRQTFTGSFSYDADSNVSGTVTASSYYQYDILTYTVTGLAARAAQVQNFAATAGDTQATNAYILAGHDSLVGSPEVDNLRGYDGNDSITGNAGDDVIDGGAGTDVAIFAGNFAAATIVYAAGTSSFTVSTAGGGTDTVSNVETFSFADQDVAAATVIAGGSTPPSPPSEPVAESVPLLVSASGTGTAGNCSADNAVTVAMGATEVLAMSKNGRYVVFDNAADNLVAGDGAQSVDTYLKDMATGEIKFVVTAAGGERSSYFFTYTEVAATREMVFPRTQAASVNGYATDFSISDDGRYVAFATYANDLVDVTYFGYDISSGDVNHNLDIYRKDMQTGAISLVSSNANGLSKNYQAPSVDYQIGIAASADPEISADGSRIIFSSVQALTNAGATWFPVVYVKDVAGGAVTAVSTDAAGNVLEGASDRGMLSADGRYAVFANTANSITDVSDLYRKDLQTGALVRVAADIAANPVDVSADGRYVAFATALALDAGDRNNAIDVYRADLQTGVTQRVSVGADGTESAQACWFPSMSDDGRYVVFNSQAEDLLPPSGSLLSLAGDVFVKDMQTGELKSATDFSADMLAHGDWGVISNDGSYIAFVGYYDPTHTAHDEQVFRVANPFLASTTVDSGTTIPAGTPAVQTYHWKSHAVLAGVSLDGSHTTGSDGRAGFVGATGTLALAPALAADATAASAVNLQDAIAILKMIVGLDVNGAGKSLSPYQALAADFDGSGGVNLTDAIGVLKHVVGLTAPTPAWLFVDEVDTTMAARTSLSPGSVASSLTASVADATGAGLVGILRGDVDGSWAAPAGSPSLDVAHFQALVTSHAELNLGQWGIYQT